MESELAAVLLVLTAGEVVAKVAGGVGAVGREHRGDFVGGVSTGVSHDARACRHQSMKPVHRDAVALSLVQTRVERRTCGDGDAQVDDASDEDGQQGSFGDGHLRVLQDHNTQLTGKGKQRTPAQLHTTEKTLATYCVAQATRSSMTHWKHILTQKKTLDINTSAITQTQKHTKYEQLKPQQKRRQ